MSVMEEALEQIRNELKPQDNTARLMGLLRLQILLKNHEEMLQDATVMQSMWHAIPKIYLIRLLKARESKSVSAENASQMNHLAVAIIHTFLASLQNDETVVEEMATKFVKPLVSLLCTQLDSQLEQTLAYQILGRLVQTRAGAINFLHETCTDLMTVRYQQDEWHFNHITILLRECWRSLAQDTEKIELWEAQIVIYIEHLTARPDPSPMLSMLAEVILDSKHSKISPWILHALQKVKEIFIASPTQPIYQATISLTAAMLSLPSQSKPMPELIFSQTPPNFTPLFLKMMLADVQASIPSLMETLNLPTYAETSLRLANTYSLIGGVLLLIVDAVKNDNSINIPPSQILEIRRDLSDTFGLTVEYFRDRWDASIAGTAGLHPETRAAEQTSTTKPRLLGWDDSTQPIGKDPIFYCAMQSLALWICEDEGPDVHLQTIGIIDVLLGLYGMSCNDGNNDFRQPVLMVFSGLFGDFAEARKSFIELDGMEALVNDTISALAQKSHVDVLEEMLRVLDQVVESKEVYLSRLDWLRLIPLIKGIGKKQMIADLGVTVAAFQLATSLYAKAPKKMQAAQKRDLASIYKSASQVLDMDMKHNFAGQEGLVDELQRIIERLHEYVD
ncbi:hypothetical protein BT63DRAFT_449117 [Microthyrium microscopicum]|uniref:DUF1941-domain-containing protein n=1 Tax=Microthyrium microscopicum TaxID=703497 RepID=A0A6A6UPC1_9PEZI|nr:hypothetical protein BT63DRAFT_449117 [Microthyrium microscopicum]